MRSGVQDQPGQGGETPSLLKIRQAWWQAPIITALWEAETGWIMRSGVQHQPGQHGKMLSLLKIEKKKNSWAWW